ncbi:MAG: hypothetical protein GX863_07700 [Firmicutes bacterium]|nr:hypothetical protein [Candidatus Fermentithermobacillaceae bacterium]
MRAREVYTAEPGKMLGITGGRFVRARLTWTVFRSALEASQKWRKVCVRANYYKVSTDSDYVTLKGVN